MVLWDGKQVLDARIEPNVSMDEWLGHYHNMEGCECVYIEMVACYGMAVGKETFETVYWIGRFVQQAVEYSYRVIERIYRAEVKLHHCGQMRAKDGNVIQSLKDKYGQKGTKKAPGVTYALKSHMWQAFAIASMVTERTKR
jgi:hypothetical protein